MRRESRAEARDARLFERAAEAYATAAARCGEVALDLRVAGTAVRLRFAGPALVPELTPALEHLRATDAADGGVEIRCFDTHSTGVAMPAAECRVSDLTARGNIWGFDSARYRSAFHWIERSVNVLDLERRAGVFWVPDHRGLPPWVVSSPLRSLLHWWLWSNGVQLVHAAAIGVGGRGVLLPGRGGAGKSSTALTCLAAGLDYVGDDYVALALDPEPRAHSLYCTAKLDERALLHHGRLVARSRTRLDPGWEKTVMFLPHGSDARLVSSVRVDEVLLPVITGRPETAFGPVDATAIERGIAVETLAHLPHTSERTVAFLSRIARELPHRALLLGTERARIPDAIRASLREPRPASSAPEPPIDAPTVSVVLCANGRPEDTRQLVEQVAAQDHPRLEVVVVNDGAAGAVRDALATSPCGARCFDLPDVDSQAEALNRGIREAFGELVLFLRHGDRLPQGAVGAMVRAMRAAPSTDVVRGRVVTPDGAACPIDARPLGGALFRRDAFRRHGLLEPARHLDSERSWCSRAMSDGLEVRELDAVTLCADVSGDAGFDAARDRERLRLVKAHLDALRRGRTSE